MTEVLEEEIRDAAEVYYVIMQYFAIIGAQLNYILQILIWLDCVLKQIIWFNILGFIIFQGAKRVSTLFWGQHLNSEKLVMTFVNY